MYRRHISDANVISDYAVRVSVCPSSAALREDTCKVYPSGSVKPTGILHDYGESDRMYFGLITGSQFNNLQGGVLRRNMGSFTEEVDANTGVFLDVPGIVSTLSDIRAIGFGYSNSYQWSFSGNDCPALGTRALANGECRMWGNPIAEMMWESLRYYAGAAEATPTYGGGGSSVGATEESTMGLPTPAWKDPYASEAENGLGFLACARPFQTVISDINPSYDSDLPGNAFGGTAPGGVIPTPISGFSAGTSASAIWNHQFGGSRTVFIGQSGGTYDSAPTAKTASSFSDIRGLSPEEPTKQGSYYSAAVAHFGLVNDIYDDDAGIAQNLKTYSIAVASPLPRITFPISGGSISMVPFAKTVGGAFGVSNTAAFQPTNTIVDFYVQEIANFPGMTIDASINEGRPKAVFRINYEDVEQGNDHDMDAIVRYDVVAQDDGTVDVTLTSEYAAGSAVQYIGYVMSGTTKDGIYLDVCDLENNSSTVCDGTFYYRLNTPPGRDPGYCNVSPAPADCTGLPITNTRTFTPGSSGTAATPLRDPLWYAAKFGGFDDTNGNGMPDGPEWDADDDGEPDNYFLVTNALELRNQLSEAFDDISEQSSPTGALAIAGARVQEGSLAFGPGFEVDSSGHDWTGLLRAFPIESDGSLGAPVWDAADLLDPDERDIYITTDSGDATDVDVEVLSPSALGADAAERLATIGLTTVQATNLFGAADDALVSDLIAYLGGHGGEEQDAGGPFRNRSRILGDIINSQPVFAGPYDNYGYSRLEDEGASYLEFLADKSDRVPAVFIGANDGMLHAFNASEDGGDELFAFIPASVKSKLGQLANPEYDHTYFVDGELTVGDAQVGANWKTVLVGSPGAGGRGVFAIDVSNPAAVNGDSVLWDLTSAEDGDIGQSIGKLHIIRAEDENWYVVFGNGYNSASSDPALFVVNLQTGAITRKIVPSDGSEAANGMGNIVPVDQDRNGAVDTIYGGDYQGNIWKFDLSAESSASWGVAYMGLPFFVALDPNGNRQPITGGFRVARGPGEGLQLYFGTGSYFLVGDNAAPADPPIETLYAVWDNGTRASGGRASLQQQTILTQTTSGVRVRTTSDNRVNYTPGGQRGWYLDLADDPANPTGERFVGVPRIQGDTVFFTTFEPVGDECTPGGRNWLFGLDALSGANDLRGAAVQTPNGSANCDGIDCGAVQIGGTGPVRRPEIIVPTPACNPGVDPECTPVDADGDGVPDNLVSAEELAECPEIVATEDGSSVERPRACGRQSWRQIR